MDKGSISRIIQEEAANVGVPAELFQRVVFLGENPGDKDFIPPQKVSPVGARGVAQVMPKVWDNLIKQGKLPAGGDPFDVRTNLRAGALVLKEGLDLNKGNEAAAVAHYNGGTRAGRMVADGKLAPAEETRKYLERTGMNTSVRTTTKVDDTGFQARLQEHVAANAALMKQFTDAVSGQADQAEKIAQASISAGAAKATMATSGGEILIAQQEHKNSIADMFNAGPNTQDNQIIEAHRRRTEALGARDALRGKIKEESSVSFLDDPLRWVATQFTMPKLVEAHNAVNAEYNSTSQHISTLQADAARQQGITAAPVTNLLRTRAAAEAAEAKFTALKEASQAMGQSKSILAQGLLHQMSANNQQLGAWEASARMFMQTQQLGAEDKADTKLKPMLDPINAKRAAFGAREITAAEFRMMNSARRDYLTANGAMSTLGKDPGDSLMYLVNEGHWAKLTETAPHVQQLYVTLRKDPMHARLEAEAKMNPGFAKLDSTEQAADLATKLAAHHFKAATAENVGSNTLSDENPYKLRLKDTLLMPALRDNPFTKVLAEKLGTNPTATLQDSDLRLAIIGMAQGNPASIPALSKQLSEFYTKGINSQLDTSGALLVGYPKLPQYKVHTGSEIVNVSSPSQVENWLTKTLIAKSKTTFGQNGFGLFN